MITMIDIQQGPDKIYRRKTQTKGTPKKKKNEKNRKRNTILNFRVSPLEKQLIEKRIELTGLPKARFFIESCLYQTILVKGNVTTFSKIQKEMESLTEKLTVGNNLDQYDSATIESIRIILEILDKWKRGETRV